MQLHPFRPDVLERVRIDVAGLVENSVKGLKIAPAQAPWMSMLNQTMLQHSAARDLLGERYGVCLPIARLHARQAFASALARIRVTNCSPG